MSGFGRKGLEAGTQPTFNRITLSDDRLKFDVTPKPMAMAFGVFMSVGFAFFSVVKMLDPRALTLNHIIHLSPFGADVFWGAMALASALMTVAATTGLVRSFGEKIWFTIDNRAITGPTRLNGAKIISIPFSRIEKVRLKEYGQNQWLQIFDVDGQKIQAGSSNVKNPAEWSALLKALGERMR